MTYTNEGAQFWAPRANYSDALWAALRFVRWYTKTSDNAFSWGPLDVPRQEGAE